MSLNGTTEKYIVVSVLEGTERPVYVYEFTANDTTNFDSATAYEDADTAKSSAELLTQMALLNADPKTFVAKKVTTIVESVEEGEE